MDPDGRFNTIYIVNNDNLNGKDMNLFKNGLSSSLKNNSGYSFSIQNVGFLHSLALFFTKDASDRIVYFEKSTNASKDIQNDKSIVGDDLNTDSPVVYVDRIFSMSKRPIETIVATTMHEIGHSFGISHSDSGNMEAISDANKPNSNMNQTDRNLLHTAVENADN